MNMQLDPREIVESARINGTKASWETAALMLLALVPKPKAPPKSKFDPRATLSENLSTHGAPAPWQTSDRKKRPTGKSVVVRVTFSDGEVQTMSTYHKLSKGGPPDVDSIVRAARESKMMRMAGGQKAYERWEPVRRTGVRIDTPRRQWFVWYCRIPAVVSAEVVE